MEQIELFKIFCGDDEIRPAMLLPFEWSGKIYATDGHKLIRCDKSFIEFELTNPHKPLNCEAVMPKENCNRIVKTKFEDFDIFKTEDELVKSGKDIKCIECNGEGEVEWEYKYNTKMDECPECDGSGFSSESRLVPNGKKTFGILAYLTVDGVFFNINIFKSIFEAQKIIGDEIISLNICSKTKPALFKIGNYEFVIMPIANKETDVSLLELSFVS
jgi:hypothetical protein